MKLFLLLLLHLHLLHLHLLHLHLLHFLHLQLLLLLNIRLRRSITIAFPVLLVGRLPHQIRRRRRHEHR